MSAYVGDPSRVLLKRLRDALAEEAEGQARLDRITQLIASSMSAEVCSIYLLRDENTLELCATEGLNSDAVHQTKMRLGQGLVGRIADKAVVINTDNAPASPGFRFMPETGEEVYSAFMGVPIQRLGETLGVLVVQAKDERKFSDDQEYGLEVVAMVIAEMTELGAFIDEGTGMSPLHQRPFTAQGITGQEGVARGTVLLHEPHILISNPIADDPDIEIERLNTAMNALRGSVDDLLNTNALSKKGEHRDILKAYRMFAHDKGWLRRMTANIESGLSAEVAIEKEQTATRSKMARVADPYIRDRLHDLDDLSNRLLRHLVGVAPINQNELPKDAVLVARNIGPAELLDYGTGLKAIVLEEGSVGSHATIVARALSIPLVVKVDRITREAFDGDPILVDGELATVHLRPDESVSAAFSEKVAMHKQAKEKYSALIDLPATSTDGQTIKLFMNAGLMAHLPSLSKSGAIGVGLFRTELQFLTRNKFPRRDEQAALYSQVLDSSKGKEVVFRTLDIGSDKVLPSMKAISEPNPALGWRAIRIGLDRQGVMRMQLQAMIRGAKGRPLSVMFPFITQLQEFVDARDILLELMEKEKKMGHRVPCDLKIGAMLETPSLGFAPDRFFQLADFISIGGNDLKQFFFAADRENELVRSRYDTLNVSFLSFIEQIADRCQQHETPVSFCGEDAGRPLEAVCFAAMGLRRLSMRAASVGPVKDLIRRVDLSKIYDIICEARDTGRQSVRKPVREYIRELKNQ